MAHITKKQFMEHGWREGDRVRAIISIDLNGNKGEAIAPVCSVELVYCAVTLYSTRKIISQRIGLGNILEIIPKKGTAMK